MNRPDNVVELHAPDGQWPERLVELGAAWHAASDQAEKDDVLSELWLLVNAALGKALRSQGRRFPGVDPEELRDIAAEKALELVLKLDRGQWDPAATSPGQLAVFITTLARNGLVDRQRATRRRELLGERVADAGPAGWLWPRDEPPSLELERERYVTALADCARRLPPRSLAVWFFRVFYQLPSRTIARHPEVGLQASGVDVLLARCRDSIRRCMRAKGFAGQPMPPGTFVRLWEEFRR
ncbi:MAG TPA: sigma-70 family RNA polymerase sigma factor [Candidatus Polarisedimenticolaceae bacterium]|nr:sigma-70 family RNA polymerase sigma factor [Candidatus Polarisedimenticolaceae bacterium]